MASGVNSHHAMQAPIYDMATFISSAYNKKMLRPLIRISKVCALLLLALASVAHAEKVWTNNVSGFWRDGTNWTGHAPPDITSFIQITNDLSKTITIDALTPTTELTVQMLTLN